MLLIHVAYPCCLSITAKCLYLCMCASSYISLLLILIHVAYLSLSIAANTLWQLSSKFTTCSRQPIALAGLKSCKHPDFLVCPAVIRKCNHMLCCYATYPKLLIRHVALFIAMCGWHVVTLACQLVLLQPCVAGMLLVSYSHVWLACCLSVSFIIAMCGWHVACQLVLLQPCVAGMLLVSQFYYSHVWHKLFGCRSSPSVLIFLPIILFSCATKSPPYYSHSIHLLFISVKSYNLHQSTIYLQHNNILKSLYSPQVLLVCLSLKELASLLSSAARMKAAAIKPRPCPLTPPTSS